ncbi:helix-turn-helix domain-containing protein [Microtetraspora sp. AC03309]|uniref:helix-turn-helix domain-containing protein n=1 Tax=Microtetraspora sp. AC03309 TaxID=2779376 RepID=UPI001E401A80|nr:helix-turn-helix domain-containing protein [Microtetraspora sp. AC03309]MCC5580607.1 helix-turn-helix domain-containing protein [Microtetraspora sp. AC03309]
MTTEELFTAAEAAAEVGVEVQTIYTWTHRGALAPASKRGASNLYRLADVFQAEKTRSRKHRKRSQTC